MIMCTARGIVKKSSLKDYSHPRAGGIIAILLDEGDQLISVKQTDGNLTRALRSVLQEAIERQRPPGERKLSASEWLVYNILDMRFVQGQRVLEIALTPDEKKALDTSASHVRELVEAMGRVLAKPA